MAQGSTLLQLLRGLNKQELQAIPERCDWCRVRKTNVPVQDLSKRIRSSIEQNVTKENITYSEAMRDIRDEVLIPGADSVPAKIRAILRETPVSTPIGDVRLVEEWFSAQLYGALNASIVRPYTVKLERPLNTRSRPSADVYVESDQRDGDYLIEVKRASQIDNGKAAQRQLKRYHEAITSDLGRERAGTFLCIIGEDQELETLGESKRNRDLSEYMDVPTTIDKIEQKLTRTEVVANPFIYEPD